MALSMYVDVDIRAFEQSPRFVEKGGSCLHLDDSQNSVPVQGGCPTMFSTQKRWPHQWHCLHTRSVLMWDKVTVGNQPGVSRLGHTSALQEGPPE